MAKLLTRIAIASALLGDTGAIAQGTDSHLASNAYARIPVTLLEGESAEDLAQIDQAVAQEPEQAGAWLDLAILQCSLGRKSAAEALFTAIENHFEPPPAIKAIIAGQRASGCTGPQPQSELRVRVGRGLDDNVNQGATNPTFSLGSGTNLINLVLAPEFRPKQDQFSAISAEILTSAPASGLTGYARLQGRDYDSMDKFNLGDALAGGEYRTTGDWLDWRLGAVLEGTWLGGELYQGLSQLQVQLAPAVLTISELSHWEVAVGSGWTHLNYPLLSLYNTDIYEARGQLAFREPEHALQLIAGYAWDQGKSDRPGGNRTGQFVTLNGQSALIYSIQGEASVSFQNWSEDEIYSPGLIDKRRERQVTLWRAALVMPFSNSQAIHLEWRNLDNHENVSLFSYESQIVQLSWQWTGGL